MKTLGAILLAAGSSSRLGQSKQLLEINGEPLVRRQASLLLSQNPVCVVVVTGAGHDAVELALRGLDVRLLHNADWQQGMGSSLACGVKAMPERVRGALLLLCDQWKIDAEDLAGLAQLWQRSPETAAVAQWQDEQGSTVSGPPVIFPRVLFSRLVKLSGEQGAHNILKKHKAGIQRLDMAHAAFDIDEPADLP